MHALQGSFADRARGVIDAGCDIALHCSGNMAEMEEVASAVPPMSPKVHDRLERAMASVERDAKGDFADAIEKRRPEESRVGKECVRTCRSRGSAYPKKKK